MKLMLWSGKYKSLEMHEPDDAVAGRGAPRPTEQGEAGPGHQASGSRGGDQQLLASLTRTVRTLSLDSVHHKFLNNSLVSGLTYW